MPAWQTLLQSDEISRAYRYRRQEDYLRFIYSRSILRKLLGIYTSLEPDKIRFVVGSTNKPELQDNTDWFFNVSHSGDWVVLAIAKNCVGIDVERVDTGFCFDEVLLTSFTQEERYQVESSLDPRLLFYRFWTRKESLIKATGKGIDDDFGQVPSADGIHHIASQLIGATGEWVVRSFDIAPDYVAAVSCLAELKTPKFYTLDSGLFNNFKS
ncbi:4'-phosphopantetheinyl transferase family protein [Spirosoma soli]